MMMTRIMYSIVEKFKINEHNELSRIGICALILMKWIQLGLKIGSFYLNERAIYNRVNEIMKYHTEGKFVATRKTRFIGKLDDMKSWQFTHILLQFIRLFQIPLLSGGSFQFSIADTWLFYAAFSNNKNNTTECRNARKNAHFFPRQFLIVSSTSTFATCKGAIFHYIKAWSLNVYSCTFATATQKKDNVPFIKAAAQLILSMLHKS